MTKAEIVEEISRKTKIDKSQVLPVVESFMKTVQKALSEGNNVYLRGFGSFIIIQRAAKIGRNVNENTPLHVPAHAKPAFKPARAFAAKVKKQVKVKPV